MSSPWSLASGLRPAALTSIAPLASSSGLAQFVDEHRRNSPFQALRTSNHSEKISAESDRNLKDNAVSVVSTALKPTADIVQALTNVPYVGAIAGVINQMIQIRGELQTHKKRCEELLDRALRKISKVFTHLAKLKGLNGEGRFDELAVELHSYHDTLKDVLNVIKDIQKRGTIQRILDRGLDELERLDRVIRDLNEDLVVTIIMNIVTDTLKKPESPVVSNLTEPREITTPLPPGPKWILERDDQRDKLVAALLSSSNPKVAVLGMGGIGKTTLACSAMKHPQITEAYERCYFVSFEGLPTSELVYASLANIFDIPADHRTSERQIIPWLLGYLAQKKTLLCLDNFETFWESHDSRRKAEELLGRLSSLDSLALLVTLRGTQRPGGVDWEILDPLQPLTTETSESLLYRISRLPSDNDSDREYIQKLLNAMGGLPLAITLIANLLRDGNETPESLWKRWCKESTSVIKTADSDDKQYQLDVSLRLSIYGPRMNEDARDILAAIAILPLGLSNLESWLDEFQSYLPPDIRLSDSILTLRNVALCSLDASSNPPRYQLLSPVRQFCAKNLPSSNKIIEGLIDLYNDRMNRDGGRETSLTYTWFSVEFSNVDAVIRHAYAIDLISEDLVGSTILYVQQMNWRGSTTYEILNIAAAALPDRSTERAQCLSSLGYAYIALSRDQEACHTLQEALEIHREVGSLKREEVYTISLLGRAYNQMGRLDEAAAVLQEGLEVSESEASDDPVFAAHILSELADTYLNCGELEEAETYAKKALNLYRDSERSLYEGKALRQLAQVYSRRKQFDLSVKTFLESIEAFKDACYLWGQLSCMYWLGRTYVDAGDFERAVPCFENAIPLAEQAHTSDGVEDAKEWLEKSLKALASEAEARDSPSDTDLIVPTN